MQVDEGLHFRPVFSNHSAYLQVVGKATSKEKHQCTSKSRKEEDCQEVNIDVTKFAFQLFHEERDSNSNSSVSSISIMHAMCFLGKC